MTQSVPVQLQKTQNNRDLQFKKDISQYFIEDKQENRNDNQGMQDNKIQSQNNEDLKKQSKIVKDEELLDPPNLLLFRWGQFIEIIFLHIGFFYINPIVSILYIYIRYGKKAQLHKNLMFWGLKFGTFLQYFYYFIRITNEILMQQKQYFQQDGELYMKGFQQQVNLFDYYMFLGIFISSIKYGFMHPNKFNIYVYKILTSKQLQLEFLSLKWGRQHKNIMETELINSILRQEIETSSFYMSFITEPSKYIKNILQRNQAPKVKLGISDQPKDLRQYAYGPYLCKELLKLARSNFNIDPFIICIICSLLRTFMHVVVAILQINSDYKGLGNKFLQTYIFVICQWYQFHLCINFFSFLFLGLREFKRKIFFIKQLAYLISAKKVEEYEYKKYFPTLNLVCDLSIRSWFKLRLILMGYGMKYYKRLEYIISSLLLIQLFSTITFIFSDDDNLENMNGQVLLFEEFLWLMVFFYIMKLGTQVNKGYETHKIFLMKNLLIINDLSNKTIQYFNNNFNSHDIVDNFMYQKIIEYFTKVEKTQDVQKIQKHCKQIVRNLEEGLQQLEYIQKYNPVTLIGIELTDNNVTKIFVGFVSIVITVVYRLFIQN